MGMAALQAIFKQLSSIIMSPVAKEIQMVWFLKNELKMLQDTLTMIIAFMTDAEKKQVNNLAVRLWIKDLKALAYVADDILDEFSYDVIHQSQMDCVVDKVRHFFSSSNPLVFPIIMAHKIKDINEKFNVIFKRKNDLGLEINIVGPSHTTDVDRTNRETDGSFKGSKIIGREIDKSNIVSMLLDNKNSSYNEDEHSVIPIVGMGGLGKTTLAQLVYNDEVIDKHFKLKIWICVSDQFDVKKLLINITESIRKAKCDYVATMDVIVNQLKDDLSGKKFLLVLDDVWNENLQGWEKIKNPLSVGSEGSKIIVTTRSNKVASIVGGKIPSYNLAILNENECWSLFEKRAFGFVNGVVKTPNLVAIGKELIKRCGGLPLAVNFLGSLMRFKIEEEQWDGIKDNEIWDQSSGGESTIMPVLKLSYDHLPSHLKQCFSYCSIFPKDWIINRETLIRLWMAEGFLPESPGDYKISMEEIGNEYLKTLLDNSFFQDVVRDDLGHIESCKMHDIVHDLAQTIAGNHECLVVETTHNREYISEARRLHLFNLNLSEEMLTSISDALLNATELRAIFLNTEPSLKKIDSIFNNNKRLRVLDLIDVDIQELPPSIGDLKHLRYLDLFQTNIEVLPTSIFTLYNLQTLRLSRSAKELPKDLPKLINLRHLLFFTFYEFEMPRGIERLSCLQTLSAFTVGNKNNNGVGCGIEALECLNLLTGDLTINHLQNVTSGEDARRANLKEKKKIHKLLLYWNRSESELGDGNNDIIDEAVLEGLQPHPSLKVLKIYTCNAANLPRWMMHNISTCLPNLVEISLSKCKCEQIEGFGKLPFLRVLEVFRLSKLLCIADDDFVSGSVEEEECSSKQISTRIAAAFPSLKELIISDVDLLEKWLVPPPAFPNTAYSFPFLEKITFTKCPHLTVTPTLFSSLKVLKIWRLPYETTSQIISSNLNSLTYLRISEVRGLTFLPEGLLQHNNILLSLEICECPDFQGFLPSNMEEEEEEENEENSRRQQVSRSPGSKNKKKTKKKKKKKKKNIQVSSSQLIINNNNSSLQYLTITGCPVLSFVKVIRSLASLRSLNIQDCKQLAFLPHDLPCPSSSSSSSSYFDEDLQFVNIRKSSEEDKWMVPPLPTTTYFTPCFPLLEKLEITQCPLLTNTPTIFPFLKDLQLQRIDGRLARPIVTNNFNSLTSLKLKCLPNLISLPRQGLMENNNILESLDICDCPDFQGFVPEKEEENEERGAVQQLLQAVQVSSSSLKFLVLMDCPVLRFFPDIRSLTSLQHLIIRQCKEMKSLPDDDNLLTCLASSLKHLQYVGITKMGDVEDFEWHRSS